MNAVLESVSDVLIVVDRGHVTERTGGSFAELFGGSNDAFIGTRVDNLATAVSQKTLLACVGDAIRMRDFATVEIEVVTPQGIAPLELSIALRLSERGKSMGAVIVGRSVCELRRAHSELETSHQALKAAQAHLVRTEKLASLGRLVAGVAHELNNPISFVYATTHALEKYASRFETYFEAVQSGATRAALV